MVLHCLVVLIIASEGLSARLQHKLQQGDGGKVEWYVMVDMYYSAGR